MNWFKTLMGFNEESPQQVRQNISLKGEYLYSKINGKSVKYGHFSTPTLQELQHEVQKIEQPKDRLNIYEIVGDIQSIHADESNANAMFQVASQFNFLEMVGPHVTPERGVGIYERDFTQGPACAIACGGGTIFRNYFVNTNGEKGQTRNNHLNGLLHIDKALNNSEKLLWKMSNGYALCNLDGLLSINKTIANLSDEEKEHLKSKLMVGLQEQAEVTISDSNHEVSQVFCSALPVSYSNIESIYWEYFARLILEATFEATFCSAILNHHKTGNKTLFLTLVGGGAFGNREEWILDAIHLCLIKYKDYPLNVKIVSYSQSNPNVKSLIKTFQKWKP